MRSTIVDSGKNTKSLSATINSDGSIITTSVPGIIRVTKVGTGVFNIRILGCKYVLAVSAVAYASPPWTCDVQQMGFDNFQATTFNSTSAGVNDLPFSFYAEYR